jgi:hypothetical protein
VALATVDDVEQRLGRPLTQTETTRAEGLLPEASALVIGYLGCDPTDTSVAPPVVPEGVVIVVSRLVARVLERDGAAPDSLGAESVTNTVGPFGRTLNFGSGTTSGGPWIAGSDKTALRPYMCGGGFVSIGISSGRTGRYRRES